MSWNSYGDASFSIDAKITTLIGPDGKPFSDPALTGATIGSGQANPPAKLVDLDVDQQTRTRYYGLNVQVGDSLLQGHFVDTAFILNLWFRKAASGSGADNQAGGLFQTILDPVQWGDVSGSPFLQLFRDTAQQKGRQISMRFAVFGYEPTPTDPSYSQGTIVGSLGLAGPEEPVNRIVNRFLSPTPNSPLWYSSAAVDGDRSTVTIDLSNSIPDGKPGGLPQDLGTMELAILGSQGPVVIGDVPYQGNQYQETGGIVQFGLDSDQLALAKSHPIAVLIWDRRAIALQENQDGVYAAIDSGYLFMNPKETKCVDLYASKWGVPHNAEFQISLVPSPNSPPNQPPVNNSPSSGIGFSSTVTTEDGKGQLAVTAGDIFENPPRPQEHRWPNLFHRWSVGFRG